MTESGVFSWQRLAQQVEGVLDVDSASLDRFSEKDEAGLEAMAQVYLSSVV
jgi:putative methionine-R-sulfoxide reductase with GAF domain